MNYNYLLDTTDAQEWAKAFVQLHGGDEGLMLAWFASAIETGRTAGESKCRAELERLQGLIDNYAAGVRGGSPENIMLGHQRIMAAARTEEAQ